MNIYLVRHGEKMENDKNHKLLELTERGFIQADIVGKRLKEYNIDKIYASNMKRALQTAEQINRHLNVELIVSDEIREIHMGACETEGWEYLKENYPDFIKEFNRYESDLRYPPDGECGEDVWNRARKLINKIINSELENVVVVTHGGVIRSVLCGILQINQARRFYLGTPPENCSISIIKYNKGTNKFYIHSFNDYAHLESYHS